MKLMRQKQYPDYSQGGNESNVNHLKNFKDILEVIEYPGWDDFVHAGLMEHEQDKDTREGTTGVIEES